MRFSHKRQSSMLVVHLFGLILRSLLLARSLFLSLSPCICGFYFVLLFKLAALCFGSITFTFNLFYFSYANFRPTMVLFGYLHKHMLLLPPYPKKLMPSTVKISAFVFEMCWKFVQTFCSTRILSVWMQLIWLLHFRKQKKNSNQVSY